MQENLTYTSQSLIGITFLMQQKIWTKFNDLIESKIET